MKFILALTMFLLFIQTAVLANDVSGNWYTPQEDELIAPKSLLPSLGLQLGLKSSLKRYQSLFQDNEIKDQKHWRWTGINTSLGLGVSGDLGILSYGGQQFVEFFWMKKIKQRKMRIARVMSTPTSILLKKVA